VIAIGADGRFDAPRAQRMGEVFGSRERYDIAGFHRRGEQIAGLSVFVMPRRTTDQENRQSLLPAPCELLLQISLHVRPGWRDDRGCVRGRAAPR
jgi:hypothetical protein